MILTNFCRRGKSDVTNALVVFELLNMFNSVDMLFSKVMEPRIKINIAGIIVGTVSTHKLIWSMCRYKWMSMLQFSDAWIISKYEQMLQEIQRYHAYKSTLF